MNKHMSLRQLLDTLAAMADVQDQNLLNEIEHAINVVDEMNYVVADHCENIIANWEKGGKEEDDWLFESEEYAYVHGGVLAGSPVELPNESE